MNNLPLPVAAAVAAVNVALAVIGAVAVYEVRRARTALDALTGADQ